MPAGDSSLSFQRVQFKTDLPTGQFYTVGHMWLREAQAGLWHIGLTHFALRMLGEPVEIDYEAKPESPIEIGQVVGWLEGFKAVSDLYAPMPGVFAGGNPGLEKSLALIERSPYDQGWLFAISGQPSDEILEAQGYADFLDATIDRMLGEEKEAQA